jgi:hypothetical protein
MERDGLVRRARGALTLVDVPRLMGMLGQEADSPDFRA